MTSTTPHHPPRYVAGWVVAHLGRRLAINAGLSLINVARFMLAVCTLGISELTLHIYRCTRADFARAHRPERTS